jgi:hypothetical protein
VESAGSDHRQRAQFTGALAIRQIQHPHVIFARRVALGILDDADDLPRRVHVA